VIAEIASPDVAVRAFKAEHDAWHGSYVRHLLRECRVGCDGAWLCPEGRRLLANADDAGRRWRLAEERAAGGGR
jgi:hypothetical protein